MSWWKRISNFSSGWCFLTYSCKYVYTYIAFYYYYDSINLKKFSIVFCNRNNIRLLWYVCVCRFVEAEWVHNKKKFKTEKKSINHTHIWIVHTGHSKKIKWKKMVQRKHEISSLYFFLPTFFFFFLKFISNMWAVVGNFTFQKILLLSLLNQLYWVGFNFKSLVNIVHTYLFNFGVLLKMEIWPISSS